MTPTLTTLLAEYDVRQEAREQHHPNSVTATDCRRLIAALRYATNEWYNAIRGNGGYRRDIFDAGKGEEIAAILRGEKP